jgi:HemY protein
MIRILALVAILFLVAAGFAWLAERPGDIVLTWQGYEVRTSLLAGAVLLGVTLGIVTIAGALLRAVLHGPQSVGHLLGVRRRDRGYRALTRGMIAVGAGDVRTARRASAESLAFLGKDEPLVLLLSAQAAQIAGDGAAARTAFEALSAQKDTRVLGLHGLFVEARRQGEHAAARHFAEEATRLQPQIGWAGAALFEYQSRAGDWESARATLATNTEARIVDKQKSRRLRAVLDTARALELEAGNPDEARALALEAHKLAVDLVPAATVAARLFTRSGDIRRASRMIEATWKASPHPELADAYSAVRPGDSARDRLNRVRRLAELRANHPEGALAVARAAIDARDWPAARAALGGATRADPTERACLLMAEIEEGEHGDQGRVRAWLTRALAAPRDPAWVADGEVFEHWAPVSPVSGRIDAFEWKVPTDRLPPWQAMEIEGLVRPEPVVQEPSQAPAAPPPRAPATPTWSAVGNPAATASILGPSASGVGGVAPRAVTTAPTAMPRPMARAPDDPGPHLPGEEDDSSGLPMFHPGRMA